MGVEIDMRLLLILMVGVMLGGVGCIDKRVEVKINVSCEKPSLTKDRLVQIEQDLKLQNFYRYRTPFKLEKKEDGSCFVIIGKAESGFVELSI